MTDEFGVLGVKLDDALVFTYLRTPCESAFYDCSRGNKTSAYGHMYVGPAEVRLNKEEPQLCS